MPYTIEISRPFDVDPAAAWEVWTDMPRFPEWDPREEETRLDGPFAVGTSGWSKQRGNPGGPFTISEIEPGRTWQVSTGLPGGRLVIDHTIEPAADGRVRLGKRYVAHGPMSLAFRIWWGPRLLKVVPDTLMALADKSRLATARALDTAR
jgi:hypothetical protein